MELTIDCNLPVNYHCVIRGAVVFHWLCTRQHFLCRSWRQWSPRVTLKWSLAKWNLVVPQANGADRQMLYESIQDRLELKIRLKFTLWNLKKNMMVSECILVDPDITSPNSALMTTAVTACSCPVSVARGVGTSPSPTMLCVRAFQCHNKTVQSADPDAM